MTTSRVSAALVAVLVAVAACSADSNDESGGSGGAGGEGGGGPRIVADPYALQAFDGVRINSHQDQPNFQWAGTTVDFRDGPFASAKLIVDLESACYPFAKWNDDPPPEGQNWPADCDAYDRNFEFVLDRAKEEGDAPGFELVRAITPFGGPLHFEIDVTDLANGLPGVHDLDVNISTWSDGAGQVSGSNGGWTVSARFEMVPGDAPRNVLAVVPLWNGSQTSTNAPGPLAFTAPPGTVSGKIEYRATGHGGGPMDVACGGHADEFCMRTHTARVDGAQIAELIPWRNDCHTLCTPAHDDTLGIDYCLENPCGHPDSVRASRANWCPGSVTPPIVWEHEKLSTPGDHELEWSISKIAEGGVWRISAVYYAYGA